MTIVAVGFPLGTRENPLGKDFNFHCAGCKLNHALPHEPKFTTIARGKTEWARCACTICGDDMPLPTSAP